MVIPPNLKRIGYPYHDYMTTLHYECGCKIADGIKVKCFRHLMEEEDVDFVD